MRVLLWAQPSPALSSTICYLLTRLLVSIWSNRNLPIKHQDERCSIYDTVLHFITYIAAFFIQGSILNLALFLSFFDAYFRQKFNATVARISTEGNFLFQKRLSLRGFFLGLLFLPAKSMNSKNLFSLICGFRFPDQETGIRFRFRFWFPVSGLQGCPSLKHNDVRSVLLHYVYVIMSVCPKHTTEFSL